VERSAHREESVKRKLTPQVGRERSASFFRARSEAVAGKNVVRGGFNEEYIARMEDVLAIYEKPLSDKEPWSVWTRTGVLHADVRPPRPMRRDRMPGAIASTSDAARPMSSAASSPRRPALYQADRQPLFAAVRRLPVGIAASYPEAHTIHPVMDNLSSHNRKALVDRFGEKIGGLFVGAFHGHYETRQLAEQARSRSAVLPPMPGAEKNPFAQTTATASTAWNRK